MNLLLSPQAIFGSAICFLCGCSVSEPAESKKEKPEEPYDVIIVPGVPYGDGDKKMQLVFKMRILWAKYLFDHKIAKNIIFSGGSVYSPYVEGKVMKIYAEEMNVPSKNIFAETTAEHSTENVHYSVRMARQMGFKRIALATDPYQNFVLKHFVRKNYPEVQLIPIRYEKIDLITAPWPHVDASPAYVDDFVSILQKENRFSRFKGTLGKNIEKVTDSLVLKKRHKYATF